VQPVSDQQRLACRPVVVSRNHLCPLFLLGRVFAALNGQHLIRVEFYSRESYSLRVKLTYTASTFDDLDFH